MTLTMKLSYFVLLPVLVLTQATWIFIDARRQGEHYYWLWGLLGLLNVPTSLIVYLLVMGYRRRHSPSCGQQMPENQLYCRYCSNVCPQCRCAVRAEWNYCPSCACRLYPGQSL